MEKKKTPRTRPLFFYEFGQEARDLLRKGYLGQNRQLIRITTCTTNGMTLKSSFLENATGSASAVRAVYNEKDNSIAAQFRTVRAFGFPLLEDGEISIWVAKARESLPPSARAEIAVYYPAYHRSGGIATNLKIWCLPHQNAAVTYFSDMRRDCREISMSASIGIPSIAFGMQGTRVFPHTFEGNCFTVWDAGIQVTKSACDASLTLRLSCTKERFNTYNKGDWLEASYVHYLDEAKKISAGVKMTLNLRTGRGRSTIGGSWGGEDDRTAVKARFNNRGILKALLHHDIHHNACLSISGEYDVVAASGPRFGLALVLKPKN